MRGIYLILALFILLICAGDFLAKRPNRALPLSSASLDNCLLPQGMPLPTPAETALPISESDLREKREEVRQALETVRALVEEELRRLDQTGRQTAVF